MSKREEAAPQSRPEASLLYSSGSWRPPGASLLPTPLNTLGGGRPGSAARPSWSKAGGGSGQPPKVTPLVMANAARAIEEGNLFRPIEVLENAFVNSATVEERAVDSELQRQSLLFSDQPRASRPGLTAMMNYLTNNNAPPNAGSGVGGGLGGSGGGGGSTRSADYAAVLAGAGGGGASPYGAYAAGFDAIPEEVSGASLEYAADSTVRPGQLSPSTSPVPGAAPRSAGPGVGAGRTSAAATTVGAAGGAGGSGAWFGPSSGTIGQGASRPVSGRPGAGRPISAKPPTGGSRPVSAVGNGAGAAGVVTLSAKERRTIEGKLIASMGLAGTGRVRGESPQGQWVQPRTSMSNAGTAAPGPTGGVARPVSAPRAYANASGASRPISATMAVAAAAAASKRRASAQAAGGGAAAVASLRPISALPGGGGVTAGSRPVSGVPHGAGTRGLMTVTVTPGEEVTLQPHVAPQMTSPVARPLSPARPTTARPPSPTRTVPSWMLTRPGSPPPDEYGGTARPMSALSTASASVAAVAAPLVETAGVPPAPYRQRNEFQQSGKKIPTGCRPLSAFSTLSSATPRNSLSLAGGVGAGTAPVVPLSESIADQPVYNEEDGPIKTSYEVVDYFSTHGQNAHKKLFYLNERRPSNIMEVVSPFDLVVVPAERVDRAQYWTMSALGVVHVEAGRPEEGQFTQLGEWIRLSTVYGLLRKMRFFKHFLLTRSFRRWRANVKRSAFERTREVLGRLLFGAVPTFQPVMLRAGQLVHAMRETAVVSITTRIDRLYSLEEFVAEQDHRRSQVAAPALAKLVDELCAEVLAVGSRIDMERERMEKLVDIPTLRANEFVTFIPGPSGGAAAGSAAANKSKSMSALKAEKATILARYDAWVAAQERMPALVRLLDYLVGCVAVELGVRGTQELLAYLDNPAKTRGVLLVTVTFEPRTHRVSEDGPAANPTAASVVGFGFAPQMRQVREALVHVMESVVNMLDEMPRPSTHKPVAAKYIKPSGESFVSVADVIMQGTPLYVTLRSGVLAHVDNSYSRSVPGALDYVRATFEDKRPIFDFSLSWDAAAYDAEAAATAAGPNGHDALPLAFRRDMIQQRRWQRQVDQMKMSNTLGILFVDSKKMRSSLQESIEHTLDDLKLALVSAGRRAVTSSLEQMRGWAKDLEPRPTDLDGYAAMRELYGNLVASREAAFRAVDAANELFELFRDYGGKPDVKDAVALETLTETALHVRSQLHELGEWVKERSTEMTSDLGSAMQELSSGVMSLLSDITSSSLGDPEAEVPDMLDALAGLEMRLLDAEEAASRYAQYQTLFGLPVDEPGNLAHVRREFEHRKAAWGTTAEWAEKSTHWLHAPCAGQDAEAIAAAVDEYYRSAYKMAKAARDDRVVAKLKEDIEAFRKYSQLLTDACNPALQAHHWAQVLQGLLGRPADNPAPGDPVSVAQLIEWGALEQAEALSNISGAASKELSLRRALSRMKEDWVGVEFKMVPYKDTGTHVVGHTDEIQMQLDEQLMKIQAMNASPFVKPFRAEAEAWQAALEGLQELLDSWLACQSVWMYLEPIFSSPDIVKQMPAEGAKFAQVDMTFRMLVDEVVANPGAIALAKESDRRTSLAEANRLLDEVQRGLSRYLEAKRLAFPRFFFLSNDEMLEILSETKDPTRVQPHLRKCFEGIHRLQFETNTNGVVSAMLSLEGEKVPFMQHINTAAARGKVEQWLLEVEARMFEAVHAVTGRGIEEYAAASAPSGGGGKGAAKPKRHEWALRWPGMVVLLAAGVFWTRGVEDALAAQKLPAYEKQCSAELREVVDLVRGELTGLQRATLGALVVMDVHARDVVAALAADKVEAAADFGWQAQLRTYWQATDGKPVAGQPDRDFTARCCMMSASLEYGYEYLGNSSRLVITPLTDRCYRTLMGAIHLNLGGAPEGPAGTGKTETTKDLAKALARQCVVFNCSDTLNYQDMAKFFKGLAAAGAWACFDEFNRINLEVLSVVAQQVLDIQRAIAARLTMFTFEGSELPLKWSAWCAITMNPGYAGRSELPDNLKALFRSVAMMVPDYAMIAEIILYSYGYLAARPAAKKIVACYKLCSEQLSSQDHYDYGMRAVMAVLRAAGNLKRRFANAAPTSTNQTPEQQETEELGLVLRSIVDVNLCKFLSHDVPLFNGIVSDLFPGITLPKPDYGPLAAALKTACANSNLQPTEYFITKATQLYEMVLVRHGLMLVGMPFSGKTAAYRTLAAALTAVAESNHHHPEAAAADSNPHAKQERASYFVLNPKSVTMGQLYGQNDPASHEWTDGVLAVLFRRCAADPSPDRKWLILDGPVDAIWIENMNTVLDDNKKLCLNSGEIIAMSAPMNLIFEVGDLAVASPATVSRCGMVYLEPQQLGTGPLLLSWLAALPAHLGVAAAGPGTGGAAAASHAARVSMAGPALPGLAAMSETAIAAAAMGGIKARLGVFFEGLVSPTIRFVRREVKEAAPSLDANLAVSWMRIAQALLTPVIGTPELLRKLGGDAKAMPVVDAVAVMALTWSAGCTAASQAGRALMDQFVRRAVAGTLSSLEAPSGHQYSLSDAPAVPVMAVSALPPEEGLLYDYYYDLSPLLPSAQAANAATAAANAANNPAAAAAGAGGAAAPPASQGQWLPWSEMVAGAPPIPADASFNSILVPTVDTAAVTFLLSTAINAKYPFLLVGPTGTGKSVTVVRCLLELDPEVFAPANIIGFSAQTSANATQALVDAKVDKRRKGVYGPAGGRRAICFIDDLNMPQRETYGAQPPIELLRQLLDHGGWYSRDNAFRAIQDILMVGAMGPPGGGRAAVTPRFSRHFATLCLTEASAPTLKHIFGTIQHWFLTTRAFPDPVIGLRDHIIAATLDVYSAAMTQLLPTPTKSHYTFNLRDCSRVVQGLQAQDAAALQLSASQMLALKTAAAAAEGGAPAAAPSVGALLRAQQEAHVRLWVHEVLRVFYDRLVDVSEQQWLLDLLRDLAYRHFGMRLDGLLSHLTAADSGLAGGGGGGSNSGTESGAAAGSITPDVIRRCLFADYMTESDENGYRPYLEIARPSAAVSRLEDLLADYNGLAGPGKRQLHLAMFLYAVEHVTRIARVLRQEGGHVLCVGVGGSGRQSLARLAAFICGMESFQVEISRSYGLNEWRDDLRRLARRAGAEAKPTVFIFGDSQAAQEAFVEDVNSLLNSGEVPNLFPHDERSAICEAVRTAFKRAQPAVVDPSPATLWSFFVGRCRANLHVVLAFSPAGDAFRERLRRFPSIVNCCTIDWFHAWPDDALDAVAAKLLAEVDLQAPGQRAAVKDLCKGFHAQVTAMSGAFRREAGRYNYVTPTSYLELISCFATLLAQRRAKVLAQQQKYENGLDKLAFTAEQVAVMRAELQALAPVLARTVAETEQLLSEIAREKEEVVEPKRAMVDVEVKQADHAAAAARAIKEECEMILSEALPALEAATQALDTIKAADIKLVQTFKSPPQAVKIVMEAVCVCLDVKPTLVPDPNMAGKKIVDWWDASKKLLMDTTLIQRLKDYDRDNIPQRIIDKIRKEYTGDPDFTPANAAKASSAAEGLCKWVHAMDQYDKVAKVVAPKRAALAEAEAEYASVLMGLHAKQAELKELLEKLAGLEAKLAESQARKAQLEAETELCALKLERAEQLMSGLGGERERWTAEAARLRGSFGAITGDMLLAAGAVAYLGAFTMPYRERALAAWVKHVDAAGVSTSASHHHAGGGHGAGFSLTAVLGDPVRIREWVIFGLPNDSFSIDSAVIAATSRRWPLCIDPQAQANRWIKAMHEAQKIKVLKLSDPDYLRTVEAAVSFGLPVLLENVGEELDPSLEPLLLKQTYRQGAQLVIKLGDNVVEYSPDFRLYLTTALRNPHYLPETAVKVALLNFSITPEGLADQLLGVAVAAEMPQLEEQRQALVVSSAENAKQLVEIEARILQVLSSTEGNILEDATAVQVLSEAKRLSDDISAKQAVAEKTQVALDAARTRYRPVAEMSAAVFFAIADLASVDYMYQYSLSWFIGLFVRSIHASAEESVAGTAAPTAVARANGLEGAALAARLRQIDSHFLYAAYCNVSRSLFEKDKLLLSFLLASRLAAHRGHLPHDQLRFLISGGGGAAPAAGAAGAPPAPLGIPPRAWSELLALALLPGSSFSSIPAHISRSAEEWVELVESPDPHTRPFPAPLDSMLSSFGKLLVLRCLRPDKLVPAVEAWVAGELGQAFVSPPPLDLGSAFAEAPGPSTPLLFVLSPGTDPWAALLRFAEERGQAKTLQVISLGQGQGPKAAALIEAARGLGGWVLLQNCHLAPSWMPTLERIWEAIREDNTDAKFRLWMTCMPTPDFPATLLQASVKMTSEPPQGLRANMRRSLALEPLSEAGFWDLPAPPAAAAAAPSSPPRAGGHRASTTGGGRRHSSVGGAKAAAEERPAEGGPGVEGPPTLKRLLFGLVFLHAAVQERRRYGPIGFNIPYGFDDGDLRISARQMRMYVLDSLQRGNPVPYEALRYAIGECNYGGRVTDDKDRLLLATMLRRIVAPEVAEQAGAALLADEEGGSDSGGDEGAGVAIREPADTTLEGYMAYVETLPTAAMPDVFGLHLNADISKDLATTNGLLASLTATSGGGGGGSGGAAAADGDAGAAALVQGLLDRVPADFDLEAVQAAYPVSYHQSLNQVLVQELARYNRLLGTLRTSLTQLGRAVAGLALLSAELEGVLQAVEAGQVPAAWKSQSFPSLKPLGGYMTDLVERCAFLSTWAERGPPAAFWLGAFFFPPAFTTAALQNFARGHQLPIDAVGFDFEMLRAEPSSLTNTPPSGVYVYGLFLEGAGWDRVGGCLTEPEPKQLYCPAPAIWFKTVRTADSKPTASYACPVYRTADRRGVLATTGHSTNFLMTVRLPLDVGPGAEPRVVQRRSDHWVLRGVAMLTSLPQ
ncbi:hypothetical protein HYH02_000363 [Chlamydomonas schloesseri]|uniref:AAA+ ATPase domain-containing protein n=1 Tax=Chlamydomonas schloesseri TaxID=2026947 RepID=A0A835WXR0_9CHLO|nr:hypothetical protein HYH02_000363 [Chlamydomonas schloesseri]|eukprot:KAG2454516.1 hypothetical protein HYH02_000363 [Chlamydomonas schloesseri]